MESLLLYSWEGMNENIIHIVIYLAGGMDHLLLALVVLAGCEAVSRTAALLYTGELSLSEIYRLILGKSAMFILLTAANQLDIVLGNSEQFTRSAVLIFLIGNEGSCVLESLRKIGLQAPRIISTVIKEFIGKKSDNENG